MISVCGQIAKKKKERHEAEHIAAANISTAKGAQESQKKIKNKKRRTENKNRKNILILTGSFFAKHARKVRAVQ